MSVALTADAAPVSVAEDLISAPAVTPEIRFNNARVTEGDKPEFAFDIVFPKAWLEDTHRYMVSAREKLPLMNAATPATYDPFSVSSISSSMNNVTLAKVSRAKNLEMFPEQMAEWTQIAVRNVVKPPILTSVGYEVRGGDLVVTVGMRHPRMPGFINHMVSRCEDENVPVLATNSQHNIKAVGVASRLPQSPKELQSHIEDAIKEEVGLPNGLIARLMGISR